MKKFFSLILAFVLIFSFSIFSFATTTPTTQPDLKSGWSVGSSNWSVSSPTGYSASWFRWVLSSLANIDKGLNESTGSLKYYLTQIYNTLVVGGTNSIYNRMATLVTNTGYLSTIRSDVGSIQSDLQNNTSYLYNLSSNSDTFLNRLGTPSAGRSIFSYLSDLKFSVGHLEDVLADDDDKALKDDSKDNQLKAQDEFFGDGANSVSSDNLGSLSSLVSAFRSFLGDDIGLGSLDLAGWEQITSSDDPWSFFTDGDQIAEDMGVVASPVPSPDFPDPDNPEDPNPPAPTYSSYVVHYYLQGTTQSLVDDKTVNNVVVGSTVTETAPPIEGYNLDSTSLQTLVISSVSSDNVITFYYSLHVDYSRYTVYYYLENTTTQLATPKSVTNVVVGSQVTETAPSITGYTLVGDSSQTITIALSGNVITFYYRQNQAPDPEPEYASYTVHYYKQGTTISVRNDKTVNNVEVGTSVTETAPTVEGYNLVGDSSQTFTVIITGNVITFYYTPVIVYSSYVVHYYVENTTTMVASDKTVNNVVVGSTVSEAAPPIQGYNLESTSPQTLVISSVASDNVITFYYSLVSVSHYLTYSGNLWGATGNPVLNSDTFSTLYYVASGYELQDGDVIHVRLKRAGGYQYYLNYNGVSYTYNSSNITFDIYQSDIVFTGSRTSVSNTSSTFCDVTFIYHDSPAPLKSPMRFLKSAPSDTSNQVVTSYYSDNKKALWGWLH